MSRFFRLAAALLLAIVGGAVVASPASAAPVTIMHATSYSCLYQSLNAGGPTSNVYFASSPCQVSSGSTGWRFESSAATTSTG